MSSLHEKDKPLILLKRSEILMAKMALEQIFDPAYPRIQELRDAVDTFGWREDTAMVYRGAAKAVVLYALHEVIITPASRSGDPTEVELWQQAQAAAILGEHFASLMAPAFTPKLIATGLINHDPTIEGPISASIPALMAA